MLDGLVKAAERMRKLCATKKEKSCSAARALLGSYWNLFWFGTVWATIINLRFLWFWVLKLRSKLVKISIFIQVPWHAKTSLTFGYLTTHFGHFVMPRTSTFPTKWCLKMMCKAHLLTAEIPCWWPVTTLIWLVHLIGPAGEKFVLTNK